MSELKKEVIVPTHDIGAGLRKSMPIEYARTGRNRKRGQHKEFMVQYDRLGNFKDRQVSLPFLPCAVFIIGMFVLAKIAL